MTSRDFCYWLQGLLEVGKPSSLNQDQIDTIRNHLNLVFVHEIDSPDPSGKLQEVHDGKQRPHNPLIRC